MTSISAVEYACRQASEYAESAGVFYCSAPGASGVDVLVAVGTVGSAVAAVLLGITALVQRKNDLRAEARERMRRTREEQFYKITAILSDIALKFPDSPEFSISWLERQRHIYAGYLVDGSAAEREIAKKVHLLIGSAVRVAATYSSERNESAPLYSDGYSLGSWYAATEKHRKLLAHIAQELELALAQWHRTEEDLNGSLDHLAALESYVSTWMEKNFDVEGELV